MKEENQKQNQVESEPFEKSDNVDNEDALNWIKSVTPDTQERELFYKVEPFQNAVKLWECLIWILLIPLIGMTGMLIYKQLFK